METYYNYFTETMYEMDKLIALAESVETKCLLHILRYARILGCKYSRMTEQSGCGASNSRQWSLSCYTSLPLKDEPIYFLLLGLQL